MRPLAYGSDRKGTVLRPALTNRPSLRFVPGIGLSTKSGRKVPGEVPMVKTNCQVFCLRTASAR